MFCLNLKKSLRTFRGNAEDLGKNPYLALNIESLMEIRFFLLTSYTSKITYF